MATCMLSTVAAPFFFLNAYSLGEVLGLVMTKSNGCVVLVQEVECWGTLKGKREGVRLTVNKQLIYFVTIYETRKNRRDKKKLRRTTTSLRPTTTAVLPSISMPVERMSSRTPLGVQGTKSGMVDNLAKRPMLVV